MESDIKIKKLHEKTEKIAEVMSDNIAQLYKREERDEDIKLKAEEMEENATMFKKSAKHLRKQRSCFYIVFRPRIPSFLKKSPF